MKKYVLLEEAAQKLLMVQKFDQEQERAYQEGINSFLEGLDKKGAETINEFLLTLYGPGHDISWATGNKCFQEKGTLLQYVVTNPEISPGKLAGRIFKVLSKHKHDLGRYQGRALMIALMEMTPSQLKIAEKVLKALTGESLFTLYSENADDVFR